MKKGTKLQLASARSSITVGAELGRGGEAAVYDIPERPDMVAKIYFKAVAPQTLAKLRVMIANPPVDSTFKLLNHYSIAWPIDLLTQNNTVVGFMMPKISKAHTLGDILSPTIRRNKNIDYDHRHFYNIAMNLATVVKNIHAKGYVIGDLNTANFMVSADTRTLTLMTVVDCDSFQVHDSASGQTYRCLVGKPEYTAPEFQQLTQVGYKSADRTEQSDLFAMAVIIYQLLMQGSHPFQGVDLNPTRELSDAHVYCLRNNIFPHLTNSEFKPSPYATKFTALPLQLQELFLQAFVSGRGYTRPSADMWLRTIKNLNTSLTQCAQDASHVHPKNNRCITCEWEITLGKRLRGNTRELADLTINALPVVYPKRVTPPIPDSPTAGTPDTKKPSRRSPAPTPTYQPVDFATQSITPKYLAIETLDSHTLTMPQLRDVNLLHTQLATTQSHVYVVNGRGTVQGFALNTNPIPKIPRDARYVVALAAGDDHCLALSFDGTVSAWGENDYNQCNVPSNLTNVIAIAANQACSMALTATGNVIVWGDDDYAQTAVPTQLEGNAQAIAAGVGHCAAITTSGKVVAWGNLEHMHSTITRDFTGRAVAIAADNDTTLILDDQQILWLFDDTVNPPKKVTTARDHNTIKGMMIFEQQVYLYLTDNRILTVETKTFNKLQYMNTSTLPYQGMIGFVRYNACNYIQTASHVIVVADTPTRGTNPEPRGFAYQGGVASTLSSMKALSHEHYVQRQHAYRHISHIACGNGYVAVLHAYKIHVFGTLDVKTTIKIQQLYGQANHLYAIDTQQRALVFGDQQQAVLVPTGLQGRIQAISIQAISFGAGHGVALLTGDMLNVWGDNSQGQLNMPRISQAAVAVATGLHHSLALLDNGRVIGWGGNKFGQATVPDGLDDIIQICACGNTSAALHKDGSVHVWGELRSRTASTFEGLHDVIAMALGPYHGAFLFRDGSVRTWGQIDPKHRPTFTPSDPVVAIACGNGYTAALTMNRRIVAWGTVSLDQQLPV